MILFIGVPTALISLAVMLWVLAYAERQARQIEEAKMAELALVAAAKLDDYISTASRIADTTGRFVTRVNSVTEEQIYGFLEDNLKVSKRIYGSAMAFEPGSFKDGDELFAPYAYRGKEGVERLNVTKEVYDWYGDPKWTWWHLPKAAKEGVWIDPFFDEGAGNIWMTTYAVPFFDRPGADGKFRGVTTVDLDITILEKEIADSMLDIEGFCVLGPKGQFIIAPANQAGIKHEGTVFDLLDDKGLEELNDEVRTMLGGGSGETSFNSLFRDRKSFYAYAPIPSPGWTMVAFKSEAEALSEFHGNRRIVILSFLGAVVLIVGVTLFASGRLAKPILSLQDRVLRIADGDSEVGLSDIKTRDEIEDLAKSFGVMQEKVTDRESRLQTARETTLTELMESAPDAMVIVNSEGKIRRFNSKATEIFGHCKDALAGMPVARLLSDEYKERHGEEMVEYFKLNIKWA